MNQDIKFIMIDELKRRGTYSVSTNGIQHYTRCPYCGDSLNLNHAHLSVKINTDTEDPMLFRCLKCGVSGIVIDTFLDELGITLDSDSKRLLKSFTKKSMRYAKLTNLDCENYYVPLYSNDYMTMKKLEYLNNRLGTEFDLGKAQEHKIVLNIAEFMRANEIKGKNRKILTISDGMLKRLNSDYIGFLSTNNNCIVFRDITGKNKYRYYKAILNEKNVNMDSFYSFPGKFDLLYTNEVNVHMAEGIFDILSIKENLIKDESENFYYASCGFGGVSIIKYIIHHAMNTGINFHIYSDNDKKDRDHWKYLYNGSNLTEWIDHIYIHRNMYEGEKDYGVPLSNIIDSHKSIK